MKIPFVDLTAQYATIRDEVQSAITAVIRDNAFISGPYVKKFEEEFANFCGARFAVGVSSGTDALRLALLACGVGPGDEVITVPNTFIATSEAISMVGAVVRFVDVGPEDSNMNPDLLRTAISSRTKAIIPVHLYGQPADMDPILEIARQNRLRVVGDAAQAHGAVYRGRPIATLGDAACFSFYPGKNLGAYGDAGALVTDDEEIASRVAMLRDHGRKDKYEHLMEGFNCRMDGLQGAILSVKLKYLDGYIRSRQRLATLYGELLWNTPHLTLPKYHPDRRSGFHLYVVRTDRRSALQVALTEADVATGIHYPIPLHRQPAYAHLGLEEGSFPEAERQAREVLSLPIYPEMREAQVQLVVSRVRAALGG